MRRRILTPWQRNMRANAQAMNAAATERRVRAGNRKRNKTARASRKGNRQ